jgi:ADP-ribosylglycohydrolase
MSVCGSVMAASAHCLFKKQPSAAASLTCTCTHNGSIIKSSINDINFTIVF